MKRKTILMTLKRFFFLSHLIQIRRYVLTSADIVNLGLLRHLGDKPELNVTSVTVPYSG